MKSSQLALVNLNAKKGIEVFDKHLSVLKMSKIFVHTLSNILKSQTCVVQFVEDTYFKNTFYSSYPVKPNKSNSIYLF